MSYDRRAAPGSGPPSGIGSPCWLVLPGLGTEERLAPSRDVASNRDPDQHRGRDDPRRVKCGKRILLTCAASYRYRWIQQRSFRQVRAPTQHRLDAPRACLLPAGRLLDRPLTRWRPEKSRPKRKARSIRRACSKPRCAGSDSRTLKTYGFPLVPLFFGIFGSYRSVWKLNGHKCAFVLESVADKLLKDFCTVSLSPRISPENSLTGNPQVSCHEIKCLIQFFRQESTPCPDERLVL